MSCCLKISTFELTWKQGKDYCEYSRGILIHTDEAFVAFCRSTFSRTLAKCFLCGGQCRRDSFSYAIFNSFQLNAASGKTATLSICKRKDFTVLILDGESGVLGIRIGQHCCLQQGEGSHCPRRLKLAIHHFHQQKGFQFHKLISSMWITRIILRCWLSHFLAAPITCLLCTAGYFQLSGLPRGLDFDEQRSPSWSTALYSNRTSWTSI